MAGVVRRLSEYVANQIAAGEVVSSPASVVKELVENAIDAGACLVIVNVKEGGSELIQIVDDGCGMSYDDALACFERHATSKIADINDIYSLSTYGFRGEALASIAAVSEVELITRREEDELGTRVVIHAGEVIEHVQTACAKGTQLIIKNLFYNIPARRNFLKSKRVETANIVSEFERIVLSYPKVTFYLYDNEQPVYSLAGSNLRSRVSAIVGKQVNTSLMELYIDNSIVEIRGYIGKPDSAKKNSPKFMFINGRYFYKSYFNKAIQIAYEKLLPQNKKFLPPYILYFQIDPSRIDVNVSPSKTEVKFDDEHSVFQILELAVKESLGKNGIVPMIDFEAGSPIDIPLFEDGDEIKTPSLDVNPYFNPFDESFSFSMATSGEDVSFRSSIHKDPSISSNDTFTETDVEWSSEAFESEDSELIDIESESDSDPDMYEDVPSESFKELIAGEVETVEDVVDIEYIDDADVAEQPLDEQYTELFSTDVEVQMCEKFMDKYLVISTFFAIYIANIQRAAWRVLYDRLSVEVEKKSVLARQKLLFPVEIELSTTHYKLAGELNGEFTNLGFEYSLEVDNRVLMRSVPAESGEADVELLFEELLDSAMEEQNVSGYVKTRRELFLSRISYASSAVKRVISDAECRYIAENLLKSREPSYTPSGKKILFSVSESDIERFLK